jgi:hypothetical protein
MNELDLEPCQENLLRDLSGNLRITSRLLLVVGVLLILRAGTDLAYSGQPAAQAIETLAIAAFLIFAWYALGASSQAFRNVVESLSQQRFGHMLDALRRLNHVFTAIWGFLILYVLFALVAVVALGIFAVGR